MPETPLSATIRAACLWPGESRAFPFFRPEGQKGERIMKRFSEYSFKDPVFCLEDIGTFKCDMIEHLALAIDEALYGNCTENERSPRNSHIITFLYGIREKAAEISEIMEKLDRELRERGFYQENEAKQTPGAMSAAA
jgi:hypothetical protein